MGKRRVVTSGPEPALEATPAAPVVRPSAAAARVMTHTGVAEWLTVERALWGAIVALALFVRVLDLARYALTDSEATLANGALSILRGDPQGALHVSPFTAGVDALIFMIFGASDVSARIVPALAGLVPVALCYRLRGALGRWSALCAALLFALSPTYLYESRSANGEIVAMAGIFAALAGAWAYLRRPEPGALFWIAAGMAVALAGGELGWMFCLVVVSFGLIVLILRRTQQLDTSELDAALGQLRQAPVAARHALIVFLLVFVAGATAALLNASGLQSALSMAADMFARWTSPPNRPASYYLQLLFVYELLPLTFGLGGLFYYLARGARFAPFLAWWLGLSLAWYTLAPAKSGGLLLFILVPLILVAGKTVSDLLGTLGQDFSLANEGVFIALGLLTCGIFGLNLSDFAQTGEQTHLLVAAVALVMLLLIGALVGGLAGMFGAEIPRPGALTPDEMSEGAATPAAWHFNFPRAYAILASVALSGLFVLFVHSSINLSFNTGADPREPMTDAPTTMEARDLKPMLEELSSRWEGDPHSALVAADASIGPALLWYLRDFRSVSVFTNLPASLDEPIVITPAVGRQPALENYAVHKMRWRWLPFDQPMDVLSFLRWQLYRGLLDVPASYDINVYAQMR